jgi:outer membrane protein assembly factor BamD (BamD/ComL family)
VSEPPAGDGNAARDRTAAAGRARAARRPPAQPESSLAAELAMLQRARRALNAGNGRLALGIVEELDERFPRGVLVEERSATRILSLCQLERVAEAQQAAHEFLARYPASVYVERVRQSCAPSTH